MIIPTNIRAYQQQQNLSARLIHSLILYLEDILPGSGLNSAQVAQSKDAVFTLIEAASSGFVHDREIQEPMIKIFARIGLDVSRSDIQSINKDIGALKKILAIV